MVGAPSGSDRARPARGWSIAATIVVVALFGAWWGTRGEERAREPDSGVALRFALDLEAARRDRRIAPGETDSDVLADTALVVQTRLELYGVERPRITLTGDDGFEVLVPHATDVERVKRLVGAPGDLEFRIEVRPAYPEFLGDRGERRTRERVWTGASGAAPEGGVARTFDATPDGFEEFRAREVDRWKRARDGGARYVPLDPRYRVVPMENSSRTTAADFAVLEEPARPEERMGGEILTNVRPGPDGRGDPRGGVHFDVKEEYQKAFGEWTGANVGLPPAIVLNGEVHSAPILNGRLTDSVMVSLGGSALGSSPGQERSLAEEQKQLVAVLRSGSLKVTPRFESLRRVGAKR